MEHPDLLPHLFRTEYRKVVSVLCKRFGLDQIEIAEDIASDTFQTAAQTWGVKGVPENPVAWLYSVAKNKAQNQLRRNAFFESAVIPRVREEHADAFQEEIDLSGPNINDSQLQMMFAICHPSISPEAQIGLSLRILCGFGVEEIANAFLTSKETINKRLFRAREKLRQARMKIELPPAAEIDRRLDTVLRTIYLLFNEGYFSASQDTTLRRDLCMEAMRLCSMLNENSGTNKPQVNALLSLMCFHASRFDARLGDNNEIILYDDQDANLWDAALIRKGTYFLHLASVGTVLSKYHIEAAIAYWHTQKEQTREKWDNILQLFNQLLQIEYSPVAALNRTFALSKSRGKEEAIVEAEILRLDDNHLYFMLLGELYTGVDEAKATLNYQKALALASSQTARKTIQRYIDRFSLNSPNRAESTKQVDSGVKNREFT